MTNYRAACIRRGKSHLGQLDGVVIANMLVIVITALLIVWRRYG